MMNTGRFLTPALTVAVTVRAHAAPDIPAGGINALVTLVIVVIVGLTVAIFTVVVSTILACVAAVWFTEWRLPERKGVFARALLNVLNDEQLAEPVWTKFEARVRAELTERLLGVWLGQQHVGDVEIRQVKGALSVLSSSHKKDE